MDGSKHFGKLFPNPPARSSMQFNGGHLRKARLGSQEKQSPNPRSNQAHTAEQDAATTAADSYSAAQHQQNPAGVGKPSGFGPPPVPQQHGQGVPPAHLHQQSYPSFPYGHAPPPGYYYHPQAVPGMSTHPGPSAGQHYPGPPGGLPEQSLPNHPGVPQPYGGGGGYMSTAAQHMPYPLPQNWSMMRSAGPAGGSGQPPVLPNYPPQHFSQIQQKSSPQHQQPDSASSSSIPPSTMQNVKPPLPPNKLTDSPSTASSAPDDSLDDTKGSTQFSPTLKHHNANAQAGPSQHTPKHSAHASSSHDQNEVVERLVAIPDAFVPPEFIIQRREFFKQLVWINEQEGEPLTAPPQVSKATVDLFKLYHAVMKRGGFEKVIRDKLWKNLCTEASHELQESSAAGYQLRKHYQKYLLKMECLKTGANAGELVKFADSQKKKKKEREPTAQTSEGTPTQQHVQASPKQAAVTSNRSADRTPQQQMQQGFIPPNFPRGLPPPPMPSHYPPGFPSSHQQQIPPGGIPPGYPVPPYGSHYGPYPGHPMWGQHPAGFPPPPGLLPGHYPSPYGMPQRPSQGPHGSEFHSEDQQRMFQQQQQALINQQAAQNKASAAGGNETLSVPHPGSRTSNSTTPVPQHYSRPPSTAMGGPQVMGSSSNVVDDQRPTSTLQMPETTPSGFSANAPTPPLITPTTSSTQSFAPSSRPPASGEQPPPRPPLQHYNVYAAAPGAPPLGDYFMPPGSGPYPPQGSWETSYPYQHRVIPPPGAAPVIVSNDMQLKHQAESHKRLQQVPVPLQPSIPGTSYSQPSSTKIHKHSTTTLPMPFRQQISIPHGIPHLVAQSPLTFIPSPDSLEAAATSTLLKKRREKFYSKDLHLATPTRILMALRSELYLDSVWAINALNVLLYDDVTGTPPSLSQMPDILGILVKHFAAILSILFPDQFNTMHHPIPAHESGVKFHPSVPLSSAKLVTNVKPVLSPLIEKVSNSKHSFMMVARTGQNIQFDDSIEAPEYLVDELSLSLSSNPILQNSEPANGFTEFSQRIRHSLRSYIGSMKMQPKPRFSPFEKANKKPHFKSFNLDTTLKNLTSDESNENEKPESILQCSKPTTLQNCDDLLVEVADRCLAISNVIRGFSFISGSERNFVKNSIFLWIINILLRLNSSTTNDEHKKDQKVELKSEGEKSSEASPPMIQEDCNKNFLLDVTPRLMDDAFVVLSNICAQLDFYVINEDIAYSIFDILLQWVVNTDLKAQEPLHMGIISPRDYCLDIFCKMSVIERNIDLLLSTGPWSRIAEFVRLICKLVPDKPPISEFSIVILNAVCTASEPACCVAVTETAIIEHLINFLETADANMNQIVQQHGMNALRENPEKIGTSVGMLRRAALIMAHMSRHENCREHFLGYQSRLLPFTVSHFMDSRVAAIVADILFEIQRVPSIGTDETKDASEDEKCEELLPCSPLDDNRLGINCDDELSRFSEAVEDEPDHCEEEAFIEEENTGVVVGVNDEIENGRVSCWEGTEDSHQGMNDDADSDDTPGATKRPRKRKTFIATDNSTDDPLVENNGHSSNHMEESTTVENSPSLAPSSSPSSVCPSSQPGSPSFTIKKLKKTEEIKERIRDVILKPTGAYSSLNNKNGLLLVEDHSIEKVNGIKSRNSDAVLLEESHDREQSPSRPLVNGSVSDCQPTSQTTATSCLF